MCSWAKAHDPEARRIAGNAQRFAARYLDKRARICYWFKLLTEFAGLLLYKVDPEHEVSVCGIASCMRHVGVEGHHRSEVH